MHVVSGVIDVVGAMPMQADDILWGAVSLWNHRSDGQTLSDGNCHTKPCDPPNSVVINIIASNVWSNHWKFHHLSK